MKKADIDPNWWRTVIASIAVTSALIVAACISGLPSTTCGALAKTYNAAVHNFGFSALLASSVFLMLLFVSAAADSRGKNAHLFAGVFATIVAVGIFVWAALLGIDSLDKAIADCYPGPKGEAAQGQLSQLSCARSSLCGDPNGREGPFGKRKPS
jgi:hypothetical protein